MPLIIFWLVPVILIVVLLLIILHNKPESRAKIYLVEPLLYLVNKWQIARIEGNKKTAEKLLSYWLPGLEMQHSLVEQIVRQIHTNPPIIPNRKIVVLNQRKLPFWAEEREIEQNGKVSSILLGSVSEVLDYCSVDNSGELDKTRKDSLLNDADKAYENGFWVLAIAHSSSAKSLENRKYKLEGLIVLEPSISDKARQNLHLMNAQAPIKFLSYLPSSLVVSLVGKIFPGRVEHQISGLQLKEQPPKVQDRLVKDKTIFGEIAKNNRYYIAKHLGINRNLVLVSMITSDEDLPADKRA